LWVTFVEKSATLHYINLTFIPRDCYVAPTTIMGLYLPKQKIPLRYSPQTKNPGIATGEAILCSNYVMLS